MLYALEGLEGFKHVHETVCSHLDPTSQGSWQLAKQHTCTCCEAVKFTAAFLLKPRAGDVGLQQSLFPTTNWLFLNDLPASPRQLHKPGRFAVFVLDAEFNLQQGTELVPITATYIF